MTDSEIVNGRPSQLSGPLATLTSEVRQGAGLYFDHINALGGVRGLKIRVVALDDAYDPRKAAENTLKLIDEEKVLALFQYVGPPSPGGLADLRGAWRALRRAVHGFRWPAPGR